MIKALIFDLGGVLLRHEPEARLNAFAEATGLTPEVIHKRLFASGYSESCDRGSLSEEQAYQEGIRLLQVRMTKARFGELWSEAFVPNMPVIDLVAGCRRNFTLALLTNNSRLVKTELGNRYPHVIDLFRPQIFSADAGLMKPDPKIFLTTLSMLDIEADEALIIDDGRANIDSAAALGFAVHHYVDTPTLAQTLKEL
jgi:putative hydrolase of the HAD superfamily